MTTTSKLNVRDMKTLDLRAIEIQISGQIDALDPKDERTHRLIHERRRVRAELYRRFQEAAKK